MQQNRNINSRNMRLRRSSRSGRSLRGTDHTQLPRNYQDDIIYDSLIDNENSIDNNHNRFMNEYTYNENNHNINNINNDYDNSSNSDIEFDISIPSDENDTNATPIPELDINELITLANQLVRSNSENETTTNNNNNNNNDDSNVHIRFPLIRSINEARNVILQYERLNSNNNINDNNNNNNNQNNETNRINNNIIWDSITQDYSGISISGTRRFNNQNSQYNNDNNNLNINVNLDNNIDVENLHRQPVWLELAGLFTVTMFMFAIYRLVTNLISISAFSENVVGDVVNFLEYVNDKNYYKKNFSFDSTINTSLIYKFALIIKNEMPYLPDTIWLILTILSFASYTILTSGVVLTSMLFATMCLTMCVVLRWRHLSDFIIRVIDNGEHCI